MFYFTPGSRYLRTVEHLIFGETYSRLRLAAAAAAVPGVLPVPAILHRARGLAIALIFIAIPVGALFGSTFYIYVKHAAHGSATRPRPFSSLRGSSRLIGRSRRGPSARFAPAFGAALSVCRGGVRAPQSRHRRGDPAGRRRASRRLWQRQRWRLVGMCIGFLPVFSMALHNWYYGGVFVLFSSHTNIAAAMPMPPHAYVSALGELLHLISPAAIWPAALHRSAAC